MNVLNAAQGAGWAAYHADTVDFTGQWPEGALVDFSIHSPPFSSLYIFSDSEADMGNCADDDEFFAHYRFLIRNLYRMTRPGRLAAVHCKQLPLFQSRDGVSGWRDFRGRIVEEFSAAGWIYHDERAIWKCPKTEMQRTKAHGLLFKTLQNDATYCRAGHAEYLLTFRRWPKNEAEEKLHVPVKHDAAVYPVTKWQMVASPVWMDIRTMNVLNVEAAREDRDEKHLAPLQLDLIERAVELWTNPGETVFSPFMGIGSEGVASLKLKRKFVGVELKASYWRQACRNLGEAHATASTLLDGLPMAERPSAAFAELDAAE